MPYKLTGGEDWFIYFKQAWYERFNLTLRRLPTSLRAAQASSTRAPEGDLASTFISLTDFRTAIPESDPVTGPGKDGSRGDRIVDGSIRGDHGGSARGVQVVDEDAAGRWNERHMRLRHGPPRVFDSLDRKSVV